MDEQVPAGLEDQVPMVLREVPPNRRHLARSMTAPHVDAGGGTWWELVDTAADAHLPPAAVALIQVEPGGHATVAALGAGHGDVEDGYTELLRVLMATLRRRSVDVVVMRQTGRAVVRALLAAGFAADPEVDDRGRYVIAL